MQELKERFTIWYIKKGYTFGYVLHRIEFDEPFCPESIVVFNCPWYIKPLLCFFSPSVYFIEKHGKAIVREFEKGIHDAVV